MNFTHWAFMDSSFYNWSIQIWFHSWLGFTSSKVSERKTFFNSQVTCQSFSPTLPPPFLSCWGMVETFWLRNNDDATEVFPFFLFPSVSYSLLCVFVWSCPASPMWKGRWSEEEHHHPPPGIEGWDREMIVHFSSLYSCCCRRVDLIHFLVSSFSFFFFEWCLWPSRSR